MREKIIVHVKAIFEIIAILLAASIPQFVQVYVFNGFKNITLEDNVFFYFAYVAFLLFYTIVIYRKSDLFLDQIYKTSLLRKIIMIWFVFTGLFSFFIFYLLVDDLFIFPEGNMYLSLRSPLNLLAGCFFIALAYKLKTRQAEKLE